MQFFSKCIRFDQYHLISYGQHFTDSLYHIIYLFHSIFCLLTLASVWIDGTSFIRLMTISEKIKIHHSISQYNVQWHFIYYVSIRVAQEKICIIDTFFAWTRGLFCMGKGVQWTKAHSCLILTLKQNFGFDQWCVRHIAKSKYWSVWRECYQNEFMTILLCVWNWIVYWKPAIIIGLKLNKRICCSILFSFICTAILAIHIYLFCSRIEFMPKQNTQIRASSLQSADYKVKR